MFSPMSSVALRKGAKSVCHEDDPLKQEMGSFLCRWLLGCLLEEVKREAWSLT